MKNEIVFAGVLLLVAINPLGASAECGNGKPPSYDDITAIQFQRHGCGTFHPVPPSAISCSAYSMFVSNWDPTQNQEAKYSQYTLPGAIGEYALSITGSDAIAVLKQHHFFQLNPANVSETDVGYSVLTVKRCATVTRISLPAENADGPYMRLGGALDRATVDLFESLDTFVQNAPKEKLRDEPADVEYNWDGML